MIPGTWYMGTVNDAWAHFTSSSTRPYDNVEVEPPYRAFTAVLQ